MNIYTSFYKKMLKRHKEENDIYIKISRSLYYPFKNVDGIYMKDLIDIDLGAVFAPAPDTSLDDYEKNLEEKDLKEFYECLDLNDDVNVFLLCFENLDELRTKADEKKSNGLLKAGTPRQCHRTILAHKLNALYNLNITEYRD